MNTRSQSLLLLPLPLLTLSCLGYHWGYAPISGIDKVAVEIFENETPFPDLEYELLDAIQEELRFRTGYRITPREEADATLEGSIVRYERGVLVHQDPDHETREIRVSAGFRFLRNDTRERLTEAESLQGTDVYRPTLGEGEDAARRDAIRRLAERIVNAIAENW